MLMIIVQRKLKAKFRMGPGKRQSGQAYRHRTGKHSFPSHQTCVVSHFYPSSDQERSNNLSQPQEFQSVSKQAHVWRPNARKKKDVTNTYKNKGLLVVRFYTCWGKIYLPENTGHTNEKGYFEES